MFLKIVTVDNGFILNMNLDMFWTSLVCLFYIHHGGKLNGSFQTHIQIMHENKNIVDDIYRNRKLYFSENYESESYLYGQAI